MSSARNIGYLALLVLLALAAVPVPASAGTNPTHQVINEPVSWTLNPDACKQIKVVINGNGQRHEEIVTRVNQDGTSTMVTNDRVSGTAVDANGTTSQWLYVNYATWTAASSGMPVSVDMNDLFTLRRNTGNQDNLHVAFIWSWTYDPATMSYWPPVDNFVQRHTEGDPCNCDPI